MKDDKGIKLTEDLSWGINQIDDYTTPDITYIGKENKYGEWWIMKIDEVGHYTHATKVNNNGYATFNEAWGMKTDLVYGNYSEAF